MAPLTILFPVIPEFVSHQFFLIKDSPHKQSDGEGSEYECNP